MYKVFRLPGYLKVGNKILFFIYLFIYILALQVHTYNYRASHVELIFYFIIIYKLLKQFLSLLININD